uniref:AlNc14C30G2837 protein n=1 Tax=Albugo laibachii Nc14 TaxID=890382 RepID=F0W7N2_9STRA|nr:AlNc14C30G2837 [Albugo laibachii Nc14]|eukprot:CCA17133.1 AlNc14C30G2837 [Albugo laibachii Nc14]
MILDCLSSKIARIGSQVGLNLQDYRCFSNLFLRVPSATSLTMETIDRIVPSKHPAHYLIYSTLVRHDCWGACKFPTSLCDKRRSKNDASRFKLKVNDMKPSSISVGGLDIITIIISLILITRLYAMRQHFESISKAECHGSNNDVTATWQGRLIYPPRRPPPQIPPRQLPHTLRPPIPPRKIHTSGSVPPMLLTPQLRGMHPSIRPPLKPPFNVPASFDMERKWLDQFCSKHLQKSNEQVQTCGQALDVFRAMIRSMLHLTEVLERKGLDLLELEKEGERGSAIHLDEKRKECETVKERLETLRKQTIDLEDNKMKILISYLRRIQKKKSYRRRSRARLREQNMTRESRSCQMQDLSKSIDDESSKEQQSKSYIEGKVNHNKSEVKAARMVLMLLDIKAKRQDIDSQEHEKLTREARKIVSLARKSQSSIKSAKALRSSRRTQDKKDPHDATSSQLRKQIEFKDPKTNTFDELVTIRRAWDDYLVLPGTIPGSSRIPPHFVAPPKSLSPSWARYLAHK